MTEELRLALPLSHTASAEIDIAALVGEYSTLLFRVANSVVRSQADAEDVVQDAFVRVLQHSGKLATVSDMRVWLVRIAWNLAIDRKRRINPDQMDTAISATLRDTVTPADIALQQARDSEAVFRAIEKLPAKERQVLLLSAIEELSHAQIADVMNKSESAVRALVFRARAHLRERLKGGR